MLEGLLRHSRIAFADRRPPCRRSLALQGRAAAFWHWQLVTSLPALGGLGGRAVSQSKMRNESKNAAAAACSLPTVATR
jgi:hypothetical protein